MNQPYTNSSLKINYRGNPLTSSLDNQRGNEIQSRFHKASLSLLDWPDLDNSNSTFQSQKQFYSGSECINDPLTGSHSLPSYVSNPECQNQPNWNRNDCAAVNQPEFQNHNPDGQGFPRRNKADVEDYVSRHYEGGPPVTCADPRVPNHQHILGEQLPMATSLEYDPQNPQNNENGMPSCSRCIHLHCKCGLCRACRVFQYVQSISKFDISDLPNQNQPMETNWKDRNQLATKLAKKVKGLKDVRGKRSAKHEKYDPRKSMSLHSAKCKTLGGTLMSEYRSKYRWPTEATEHTGDTKGSSKWRSKSTKSRGNGRDDMLPKTVVTKGPWNPSIRLPSKTYELSLGAAEDKLAELDRILVDPVKSTTTWPLTAAPSKLKKPEIPKFGASKSPSSKATDLKSSNKAFTDKDSDDDDNNEEEDENNTTGGSRVITLPSAPTKSKSSKVVKTPGQQDKIKSPKPKAVQGQNDHDKSKPTKVTPTVGKAKGNEAKGKKGPEAQSKSEPKKKSVDSKPKAVSKTEPPGKNKNPTNDAPSKSKDVTDKKDGEGAKAKGQEAKGTFEDEYSGSEGEWSEREGSDGDEEDEGSEEEKEEEED